MYAITRLICLLPQINIQLFCIAFIPYSSPPTKMQSKPGGQYDKTIYDLYISSYLTRAPRRVFNANTDYRAVIDKRIRRRQYTDAIG